MKVVLYTQIRENYGTTSEPFWKNKGGSIYVIPNLTEAQAKKAVDTGCPNLVKLIDHKSEMMEEFVISIHMLQDGETVAEDWEPVTKLHYVGGKWHATQVNNNSGHMRKEIRSKFITYVLGVNDYNVYYEMTDGSTMTHKELQAFYAAA